MAVSSPPRTLAIVPAWNEQDALPATLEQLRAAVPHVDVLVVDDGSTDATAEVARGCGVMVARMPINTGVGCALRAGFCFARDRGYDRALQVDADGQHAPDEIPALLAALDDGAAMVVGSRFAGYRTEHTTYVVGRTRRLAMRMLTAVLRVLLGQHFTDTSSGFRAFDRRAIELFATHYPVEYLSDTVEALLLCGYRGLPISEVPVRMLERQAGTPSHQNVRLVWQFLRLMLAVLITASMAARRHRRGIRGVAQ